MKTYKHLRALAAFAAVMLVAVGAGAATYPYPASRILGAELVTQTCAGWGLTDPVGASSCDTVTITRTASASDVTLTNSGTVIPGATYQTTMVVTRSAGSVTLSLGGTAGATRSSSATFTEKITSGTGTGIVLTFSADFAGTVETTVMVSRIEGWAQYTPNTLTTPSDHPDDGAVIPADAIEVVMSVESYPIRFLYNKNPTATLGVLIPAGSVLRWGAEDIAKFRAIRFIDTAAGASTVNLVYALERE